MKKNSSWSPSPRDPGGRSLSSEEQHDEEDADAGVPADVLLGAPLDEEDADVFEKRVVLAALGESTPRVSTGPNWVRHDFRSPARGLAAGEFAEVERQLERFAGILADRLDAVLRGEVAVRVRGVEALELSAWFDELPEESSIQPATSRSLRAGFFLSVEPRVALACLHDVLGGRVLGGRLGEAVPVRELTPLEESLLALLYRRILAAMDETWSGAPSLDLALDQPAALETAMSKSATALRLVVELAYAGVSGALEIVVPDSPLFAYLGGVVRPERTKAGDDGDAGALAERLRKRLEPVAVEVGAELTTAALPLRALLALRPGDVIDTGLPADAPVDLFVGDRRVARGRFGSIDGRSLAVRVD